MKLTTPNLIASTTILSVNRIIFLLAIWSIIGSIILFPDVAGFHSHKYKNQFRNRNRISSLNMNTGLIIDPLAISTSIKQINSIGMPRVLSPAKDKKIWQIWFHGRDSTMNSEVIKLSTGKIYYGTSFDGLKWELHPESPVLTPSDDEGNWWLFDSTHVGLGDIIQPGQQVLSKFIMTQEGMYLMYIFGGNKDTVLSNEVGALPTKGAKMEIGIAISQDGIHWSRVEGPSPYGAVLEVGNIDEFDGQYVGWPNVVEVGGEYRMYYNTYNPWKKKFMIGLAIAKDGLRWKKMGAVFGDDDSVEFDAMGATRRHVILLAGGELRMWYEAVSSKGVHSIGLAKSTNGIVWTRMRDQPVFSPSSDPLAWDSGGVGSPHLVWMPETSKWRLYYSGTSLQTSPPKDDSYAAIGVAESTDSEGMNFQRIQ